MKTRVQSLLRRVLVSLVMFAGLLAIANMESPIHEEDVSIESARKSPWLNNRASGQAIGSLEGKGAESLRRALAQDEIYSQNPFETLTTADTLQKILDRGVVHFERETMRSNDYQDEHGYDLVHYQIEHPDSGLSHILAFGQPNQLSVLLLTPAGEKVEYALFEDGTLNELFLIPNEEGDAKLAQRLSTSIPFLSVTQ